MSRTLVLVRHGQSTWNSENRFTGGIDVPLSERGVQEARDAGMLLSGAGYALDTLFEVVLLADEVLGPGDSSGFFLVVRVLLM